MNSSKNRWLIALCAVLLHLCIGSAYAWSVFAKPLSTKFGWSATDVAFTFSLAIALLGISAAFLGHFVERRGPRVAGTTASIFFGAGVALSGLAVHLGSLYLLYLTYGIIAGIGLGIGYIAPVSTLVKWFPDRRGMATGMAVFGFGAGSLVTGPIAAKLIQTVGISGTFYILGAAYFIVMFSVSQYLAPPAREWTPPVPASQQRRAVSRDLSQLTANEAVRTKRFWMLWVMLFINVSAGIMLISQASPMAQEKVGMSAIAAAAVVGAMGLFNGGGRIVWASASDWVGRPNIFTFFFLLQLIAFLYMPSLHQALLFEILLFAIISCYGGGFASIPAYIGDLFGTKQLGAIHGYILTAWSAAGIVGPMVVAAIKDATKSYDATFYVFAGLLAVALAVSLWIRLEIRVLRQANESQPTHTNPISSAEN
ncbi:OFA family MFS transporter [Kyrpidia sp.]|uniref:L-lactate MFS transporter n=1 Tax=Kyrpidia sp. TaxID=2073077 RepID=UPI00258AC1A0|nr:OFA family MFS transporter [Kyrpidia sp.]MCL6576795.1 OFA family MFS transporter [Kyrpidia sp.]